MTVKVVPRLNSLEILSTTPGAGAPMQLEAGRAGTASTRERGHIAVLYRGQEPQLTRNLALADLMKQIGERHGRSAGEVAIAWTLRHAAITAAIVGMRSAEQVHGVIGAMNFRLSEQEIAEIASA